MSGEIAEDITAYFVQSEQVPTACALGVLVDVDHTVRAAGGYLIQLLPGAPDAVIDRIEAGIAAAGAVTGQLDGGLDAEALLRTVLSGFDLEMLEKTPVAYRCYCSRERVRATLVSLGKRDLRELAEGGEDLHVGCQFCDADYVFPPEEIRALLESLD